MASEEGCRCRSQLDGATPNGGVIDLDDDESSSTVDLTMDDEATMVDLTQLTDSLRLSPAPSPHAEMASRLTPEGGPSPATEMQQGATPDPELGQLINMGFAERDARSALVQSNGDVGGAIAVLTGEQPSSPVHPESSRPSSDAPEGTPCGQASRLTGPEPSEAKCTPGDSRGDTKPSLDRELTRWDSSSTAPLAAASSAPTPAASGAPTLADRVRALSLELGLPTGLPLAAAVDAANRAVGLAPVGSLMAQVAVLLRETGISVSCDELPAADVPCSNAAGKRRAAGTERRRAGGTARVATPVRDASASFIVLDSDSDAWPSSDEEYLPRSRRNPRTPRDQASTRRAAAAQSRVDNARADTAHARVDTAHARVDTAHADTGRADGDGTALQDLGLDRTGLPNRNLSVAPVGSSSTLPEGARARQVGVDHPMPPPEAMAEAPDGLRVHSLFPYQRASLAWMLGRERGPRGGEEVGGVPSRTEAQTARQEAGPVARVAGPAHGTLPRSAHDLPRGGLLADEPGMGKTVQLLALCLANRPSSLAASSGGGARLGDAEERSGHTLVVAPLTLVRQWSREIEAKTEPRLGMRVCVHHGTGRCKSAAALAQYDFVITTYETLRSEHAAVEKRRELAHADGEAAPANDGRVLLGLRWWRVVLDEAHVIRNSSSAIARGCFELRATHRWCLTGTPMQNHAGDLYALFRFLRVPLYGEAAHLFKQLVEAAARRAERGDQSAAGVPTIHTLLERLMIRRLKADTFGGAPILTLPRKAIELRTAALSEPEEAIYNALASHARVQYEGFVRKGTVRSNMISLLALITRLRQACDSPELVEAAFEDAPEGDEPAAPSAAPPREPSAEARARAAAMAAGEAESCPICFDVISGEGGAVTVCGHAFCHECIMEVLHRAGAENDSARCPNCRHDLTVGQLFRLRSLMPANEEGSAAGGGSSTAPPPEGSPPQHAPLGPVRPEQSPPPRSAKTKLIVEALRQMLRADGGAKAIVYSSFTKYLDVVQTALAEEGHAICRLDGSMNVREREEQMRAFEAPGTPVLLMSLKCGVGLNLTCATHVLLSEPWWNPFVDEQAIDRVHRIGQTRPVTVLRLAVPGTIEEHILKLQERKSELARQVLGDANDEDGATAGQRGAPQQLNEQDIHQLFSSMPRGPR